MSDTYNYTSSSKPPGLPEYYYPGAPIPSAQAPGADPNLNEALKYQTKIAKDFRSNIPQYAQQQQGQFVSDARKKLAGSITDINKNFNSRGLFRSGARQGAVSGAKYSTMSDIDNSKYQINQGLENQAESLEGNALNTAYGIGGQGLGLGPSALNGVQTDMNQQLAQNMANQQLANGLLGGVSSGIGTYLGSRR